MDIREPGDNPKRRERKQDLRVMFRNYVREESLVDARPAEAAKLALQPMAVLLEPEFDMQQMISVICSCGARVAVANPPAGSKEVHIDDKRSLVVDPESAAGRVILGIAAEARSNRAARKMLEGIHGDLKTFEANSSLRPWLYGATE
jgi:hypothetical protein